MVGLADGENVVMFTHVNRTHERDRQTDGQTLRHGTGRAIHSVARQFWQKAGTGSEIKGQTLNITYFMSDPLLSSISQNSVWREIAFLTARPRPLLGHPAVHANCECTACSAVIALPCRNSYCTARRTV